VARPALGGGATCESCPSIDVLEWHRQGRLESGQQFSWSWTCDAESVGSISVRVESAAVVLRYRRTAKMIRIVRDDAELNQRGCHVADS
jgi:hypothetical protein